MSTETRSIDQLTQHPEQNQLWGDLSEGQFHWLVDDMRNHGQRDPIDIDLNDRIVDGHQRWRAAKLLGLSELEVRVVSDAERAEELFLTANLHRRQLDPIQQARAIKAIVARKQKSQNSWERRDGELREEIGRILNITGRSVSRLLQLLRLPVAIQNAVSHEKLPQSVALKLERLPTEVQREIATAIEAGQDAKEAALDALSDGRDKCDEPSDEDVVIEKYRALLEFIEHDLPLLRDSLPIVTGKANTRAPICMLLNSAIEVLAALREHEDRLGAAREERLACELESVA